MHVCLGSKPTVDSINGSLNCLPPGSDRLPPGRATRSGESEERPSEKNQDVGVCAQTGAVSSDQSSEELGRKQTSH